MKLCVWLVQGPGWWALRLLESRVYVSSFLLFPVASCWRHSFMAKSCGDDMTKLNFLRGSSSDSCFLRARQRALMACLSGQRGCAHCAHRCARAAFRPYLDPFLLVLPTPLHEVLCFRRHDFVAQTVGFVGRSCQRERFPEVSVAGDRSVDRAEVRGIRTFFRRSVIPVH